MARSVSSADEFTLLLNFTVAIPNNLFGVQEIAFTF